jgi:hypothetical protein
MRSTSAQLRVTAAASILALAAMGCGGGQIGGGVDEPGSSTAPPSFDTPMSTMPPPVATSPGALPSSPTDPQPTDWIAGRVIQGGSGPCYGLETDDGVVYALYSDAGIALETGAVVRVQVEPLLIQVSCGPGRPVRMLKAEVL